MSRLVQWARKQNIQATWKIEQGSFGETGSGADESQPACVFIHMTWSIDQQMCMQKLLCGTRQ